MHTLTLKLCPDKNTCDILEKRFRMLWHMHNTLVRHMIHRLHALERDRAYIDLLKEYRLITTEISRIEKTKNPDRKELRVLRSYKKDLSAGLTARCNALGVSKDECESYIKKMQHRFRKNISSAQAQKEADHVWNGVEKILFGSGKKIHFKRLNDMLSVQQKSAINGVKFYGDHIEWLGISLPVRKYKDKDGYICRALESDLSYCIITRKMFSSGWRYYAVLYLKGDAPAKFKAGSNIHGIDPGVSTMAHVSESSVGFHELAPRCRDYNRQIAREQRLIDRQMRQANPDNYKKDGTVRPGKKHWITTKGCRRRKQKLKALYRKKSDYTFCSHNKIINQILKEGRYFLVESMDYAALAKRSSKPAERQDKASAVHKKDGTVKQVRKFRKKKRFGKSVSDRSPSLFLRRLKIKAELYGGSYSEINTRAMKASQFDHTTGEYKKIPLSQRTKEIGGHRVLRDLYSAFLIFCSNAEGTAADCNVCAQYFDSFLTMQDALIAFTGDAPHPACFGY